MKKLIISLLFSGLLFGVTVSNAQIRLKEVTVTGSTSKTEISQKVSDSFNKLFKDALEPQWFEVNKRFIVNFIEHDLKNKAVFTKAGTLVYHLIYGTEDEMPKTIKDQVRSRYLDYAITSAVNVQADGNNNVWVVNVENAKEILVLRVEDGNISEIQKIYKT